MANAATSTATGTTAVSARDRRSPVGTRSFSWKRRNWRIMVRPVRSLSSARQNAGRDSTSRNRVSGSSDTKKVCLRWC
jgi:hypothetical protein